MDFACDFCGRVVAHDPKPGGAETEPRGWVRRRFGAHLLFFCDRHGGEAAYRGGLQPHVRAALRKRGIDIAEGDEGSSVP